MNTFSLHIIKIFGICFWEFLQRTTVEDNIMKTILWERSCKLSIKKASVLKGTLVISKGSIVLQSTFSLYWLNITVHISWQHLLIVVTSNSHAKRTSMPATEQAPYAAELGLTWSHLCPADFHYSINKIWDGFKFK